MLEQAKEYIKRGWYVFPLHGIDRSGNCTCGKTDCPDAGKHPRLSRGLKQASIDPNKIEEWFGKKAPTSNIGIVTGAISNITVIDIDIAKGKKGAETWAEAIKDHGEPETLMQETGSGGIHVIFSYNSALKTASNVLGAGVDSRNDGGYIVAAPSKHKSGGVYTWSNWGENILPLPAHLTQRKEKRGRPKKDDMYRGKYTIEQVIEMLEVIPADDRDDWRNFGIILGREFKVSDKAWEAYTDWAGKFTGKKGRKHDEIMREAFYDLSQQQSNKELTLGTIVALAIKNGWTPKAGEVPIGHFIYFAPANNYIYRPTASYWIAAAVDVAVTPINEDGKIIKASDWLKLHQLVTSMTCDPQYEDDYMKGVDCREGEIIKVAGAALFNTYRKPTIELGDAKLAKPFIEHIEKIFNKKGDAKQFLDYMAHRVQKPHEKPRFSLLIAGGQGIGKDTAIEFCCPAIGAWNVASIEPMALESSFNEYASKTLVRISEAANLHEMTKWAFNERTKTLIAGSPDTCSINPKYGQKYSVRMYCGVIITTNHLAGGIYIPEDDRRYDVIDSATLKEMGLTDPKIRKEYFGDLWDWFYAGGSMHIAALLNERNIKGFSASGGQRKTDAHSTVVATGLSNDMWCEDIIEELGNPIGLRTDIIIQKAIEKGEKDYDIRRRLGNTLGRLGYTVFRYPKSKDGRWRIAGRKTMVYVQEGTPKTFNPLKELAQEAW